MSAEEGPNWLDDTEMEAWLPLMGLMVLVPAQLDAQMQRAADLNQFEYLILAGLSQSPDRTMRISELAAKWYGSLSRLSHLIKRLEQRGWVRREADRDDGRYTNAVLTEAGWEKILATAPLQVEIVRRLVLDHLTRAQLRQAQTIAQRVIDANTDDTQTRRRLTRRHPSRASAEGCPEPGSAVALEAFVNATGERDCEIGESGCDPLDRPA
jgi:DNA-binding MarR family transcriptional regulator